MSARPMSVEEGAEQVSKPLLTQDYSHLAAPSLQGPALLALGTEAGAALGRASVSPSGQWGALEA